MTFLCSEKKCNWLNTNRWPCHCWPFTVSPLTCCTHNAGKLPGMSLCNLFATVLKFCLLLTSNLLATLWIPMFLFLTKNVLSCICVSLKFGTLPILMQKDGILALVTGWVYVQDQKKECTCGSKRKISLTSYSYPFTSYTEVKFSIQARTSSPNFSHGLSSHVILFQKNHYWSTTETCLH